MENHNKENKKIFDNLVEVVCTTLVEAMDMPGVPTEFEAISSKKGFKYVMTFKKMIDPKLKNREN